MKPLSVETQARVIERWKQRRGVTGGDYVPRNSGVRRTAAKRALLRDLDESARAAGRPVPFPVNF